MQISVHAAQHLAYSSVLLHQITLAVAQGFPAGHGASMPDTDTLIRFLDAISEALERLSVHIAILLIIIARVVAELAKLVRRAWHACARFGRTLRTFAPAVAAVARPLRAAMGRLLLLTPSRRSLLIIVVIVIAVVARALVVVLTR